MNWIEQIACNTVDVIQAFEVDPICGGVANFRNPPLEEFAIDTQEPALAILCFDFWIHDPAANLQSWYSALGIEPLRKLDIERYRNSVKDLGANALRRTQNTRDCVGGLRPRTRDRQTVIRHVRQAKPCPDGSLAVSKRVICHANARRKIQLLRGKESVDSANRCIGELLCIGGSGAENKRRE